MQNNKNKNKNKQRKSTTDRNNRRVQMSPLIQGITIDADELNLPVEKTNCHAGLKIKARYMLFLRAPLKPYEHRKVGSEEEKMILGQY